MPEPVLCNPFFYNKHIDILLDFLKGLSPVPRALYYARLIFLAPSSALKARLVGKSSRVDYVDLFSTKDRVFFSCFLGKCNIFLQQRNIKCGKEKYYFAVMSFFRGVARIFQRGGGGHTGSNNMVMAFSPRNIVGCLLKKKA